MSEADSAPERIAPETDVSYWVYENGLWADDAPEYIRADLYESLTAEREQCCELVIAASLATGPADTTVELMQEVLAQVDEIRAERDALKAAICKASHESKWIGQRGNPGWCLGCDEHRSIIRENAAQENES